MIDPDAVAYSMAAFTTPVLLNRLETDGTGSGAAESGVPMLPFF